MKNRIIIEYDMTPEDMLDMLTELFNTLKIKHEVIEDDTGMIIEYEK